MAASPRRTMIMVEPTPLHPENLRLNKRYWTPYERQLVLAEYWNLKNSAKYRHASHDVYVRRITQILKRKNAWWKRTEGALATQFFKIIHAQLEV